MGLSDVWKGDPTRGPEDSDPAHKGEGKDPLIGSVIGDRYIVESVLGMGGMGVLYVARHRTLEKKFVIKLIRVQKTGNNVRLERERFFREAKTIAKVNHPNVVDVVDYEFLDEDTPYIVMELIEGKDLACLIESQYSGGMPLNVFRQTFQQVCDAVSAIHRAGIVHRDLKPQNIMVTRFDAQLRLKVLDFGLAHIGESEEAMKLTATGVIMGTPVYMAPEQCLGGEVTPATDIYALGLIAYEMLVGHPPFQGKSLIEIANKQANEPPVEVRELRPDIPPAMNQALMKALAKDPNERFASASEFAQAMLGLDQKGPQPSSPVRRNSGIFRGLWTVGLGLLLVGFFALAWSQGWLGQWEQRHLLEEANRLWDQGAKDKAVAVYLDYFPQDPLNPVFADRVAGYVKFKEKFQQDAAQSLKLLNWENYLGNMTTYTFSQERGTGVLVVTYDQIEKVEALIEQENPDLIIVTEGLIRELIVAGKLLELDKSQIPNWSNLEPAFKSMSYDSENRYSIPYVWGTLGLFYNPKAYPKPPDSWDFLFNPELMKGKRVVLPDYSREIYGLALKRLGYSFNAYQEPSLSQARMLVRDAFPYWQVVGTEIPLRKRLLEGDVDLALVWSGFAHQLESEVEGMVFVMPEEGSNLSVDNLAIPVKSRHVSEALAFINHILKGDVAADIGHTTHYEIPNKGAHPFLHPDGEPSGQLFESLLNCDLDLAPSEVLDRISGDWEILKNGPAPKDQ
ncbi:MAG: extracellular solute-binding protein [Acidobacteria bacterium]|nr:extracellular solute-binding protein [Acidobacteriota bacterium]